MRRQKHGICMAILLAIVSHSGCKKSDNAAPVAPRTTENSVSSAGASGEQRTKPADAPRDVEKPSAPVETAEKPTPEQLASYCVVAITAPEISAFLPVAINNSGEVVGRAILDDGVGVAAVWQDGAVRFLESADGVPSAGTAIAENGWTAGWIEPMPQKREAAVWKNGQRRNLGSDGPRMNEASGINDEGLVSGWTHEGSPSQGLVSAVSWSESRGSKIHEFGFARFVDVNNSGTFVGMVTVTENRSNAYAFVSYDGQATSDLGSLEGFSSVPYAINDHGAVVGTSLVNRMIHGFIWQDGQMTDLGVCDRSDTVHAMAINNDNQVVGLCMNIRGIYDGANPRLPQAFLWDQGTMTSLNDLIPSDSGWDLIRATGINDKGMIVGEGSFNGEGGGFLLIPSE